MVSSWFLSFFSNLLENFQLTLGCPLTVVQWFCILMCLLRFYEHHHTRQLLWHIPQILNQSNKFTALIILIRDDSTQKLNDIFSCQNLHTLYRIHFGQIQYFSRCWPPSSQFNTANSAWEPWTLRSAFQCNLSRNRLPAKPRRRNVIMWLTIWWSPFSESETGLFKKVLQKPFCPSCLP